MIFRFAAASGRCSDAEIGDSIAINGCCLTVVAIEGQLLTFQAGSETLSANQPRKTCARVRVNLERSLQVGQRMGGHYVTGHIDASATVGRGKEDGEWAEFWFGVPPELTQPNGRPKARWRLMGSV